MKIIVLMSVFILGATSFSTTSSPNVERHVLVIIDVQRYFIWEREDSQAFLANVRQEVRNAVNQGFHIICVEYSGSGETDPGILQIVDSYPQFVRVTKRTDGGAREVMKSLQAHNIEPIDLRVIGLNSCCCVLETVDGLIRRIGMRKPIFLPLNALNDYFFTRENGAKALESHLRDLSQDHRMGVQKTDDVIEVAFQ